MRGETFLRKKFPLALPFKKLLKNGFLKFVTVLFCTNGIVFLMGPLPHKFSKIICFTSERTRNARPYKKSLRDPFDYARFAALRSG